MDSTINNIRCKLSFFLHLKWWKTERRSTNCFSAVSLKQFVFFFRCLQCRSVDRLQLECNGLRFEPALSLHRVGVICNCELQNTFQLLPQLNHSLFSSSQLKSTSITCSAQRFSIHSKVKTIVCLPSSINRSSVRCSAKSTATFFNRSTSMTSSSDRKTDLMVIPIRPSNCKMTTRSRIKQLQSTTIIVIIQRKAKQYSIYMGTIAVRIY